ncbi:hypothetical protein D6833_10215, partial [Candidatus Parcubacteria bacterium]
DLARLLLEVLTRRLHGVYHIVSPTCTSKYAFGVALAKQFGYDASLIQPSSIEEARLAARRAHRLTLRSEKLARAIGRLPPTWKEGLIRFHVQAQAGYPRRLRAWVGMTVRP